MEEGIILSTGKVERAVGPNVKFNTGNWMSESVDDPDLKQLLADDYNLRDRASLEFNFTPTSEMISKINYILIIIFQSVNTMIYPFLYLVQNWKTILA